ncbi:MAG TPA: leishmanolysin-related zinc metalloendopeptidase [Gemmatimonadaceae bacterium]|jgi:hypothetical protein
MKTLIRGTLIATVVFAVACGGGDSPPVPAAIVFTPTSVAFDAIGATASISVVVNDDKGHAIGNAIVAWTAAGTGATLTPPAANATPTGTHTASVAATAEGQTIIKATAGNISATLNVVVDQKATSIVAISGDNQTGAPSRALASPIVVQLRDRLGTALTDGSVAFDVVDGGGSVSPATATTSGGSASTAWTLGAASGAQHITANDAAHSLTAVTFTATASAQAGVAVALLAQAGGNQALLAGSNATPPAVKAVDANGAGVAGVVVTFGVTAGGGSISPTTNVTTGADGVATLARWTMGSVGALNEVTATAPSIGANIFDNAGCDAGATTGFGIELCYRTTMTSTQRQAFVSAAAKWSSIITNDVTDIPSGFGTCGGSVQLYSGTVDDLLIFATIDSIDGPFNIVGSAGPCSVRQSATALMPIIGSMHFDIADVATLETRGLLNSVILHEMGHVLGIGTFWQPLGLLVNPSTASSSLDTYLNAPNAKIGFDAIGGTTYTGGNKVPVENTGGTGTINGHWRESVLRNELMTGTIDNGAAGNPLSLLTVRSLQDLGYTVNTANADPFFLTLASRLPGPAADSIVLANDILTIPLTAVDSRGRSQQIALPRKGPR